MFRNLKVVFCVGVVDNTFRIILYKTLGLLTPGTLKSVLLLIPFALLGLFMGIKCCGHMNEKSVRKITIVLLILSVIFKGEPYIIEGFFPQQGQMGNGLLAQSTWERRRTDAARKKTYPHRNGMTYRTRFHPDRPALLPCGCPGPTQRKGKTRSGSETITPFCLP